MKNYRIFVEKLSCFQVEAESLRRELNDNLDLGLRTLRLVNVYDLFGFTEELLEKSRYAVFGEVVTDRVTDECDLAGTRYLAVECLPGQFDQRAASAVDCVRLIDPQADVRIKSSKLLVFDGDLSDEALGRIRRYYINAVESREKDLAVLDDAEQAAVKPVPVLDGFRRMEEADLADYCKAQGLAMSADDLAEVVGYFRREGRDPYETELRTLQYDMLYGDRVVYGGENPFEETDMRFGTRDVVLHRAAVRGDTLTAYGENFTPYSAIYIDGTRYETTFVSENKITCTAEDLPADARISVRQVAEDGTELSSAVVREESG